MVRRRKGITLTGKRIPLELYMEAKKIQMLKRFSLQDAFREMAIELRRLNRRRKL